MKIRSYYVDDSLIALFVYNGDWQKRCIPRIDPECKFVNVRTEKTVTEEWAYNF